MESRLGKNAVVVGHLLVTAPAIAAIGIIPILGYRQLGPSLFPYYVLAGITLAWQCCSMGLAKWSTWLSKRGVSEKEARELAHHVALSWPKGNSIGEFAFHTTSAAVCGIHLGPWLFNWLAWGLSQPAFRDRPTANNYLDHFEVVSIVPALVAGYILSRSLPRFANWAWAVPTMILAYKMVTYTEPYASVLAENHPSTVFSYFFVIQRTMPTFTDFAGIDIVRVAAQMLVVAPFLAGAAYSVGAMCGKHQVVERFFGRRNASPQPEPDIELDKQQVAPNESTPSD